ncbi:MAG: universal stress protein [Deltaproteobacteria bacterium]|nr:universal stress protein [Deltaproteobacteria bacterium]
MSNDMDPLDLPRINRPDWPRHAPGAYPILVCVQFDETGHNALTLAMRFAEAHRHAPLQIAHVVPDTSTSGRAAVTERHTAALEEASKKLEEFVASRVGERPLEFKLHVRIGDVVQNVFQLALDYDVELIVVGTHGHSAVSRLAFGSVAQKIVEAARCPVLIAAPRDFSGMEPTLIPDPPRP